MDSVIFFSSFHSSRNRYSTHTVVLGGTHQENNSDTNVNDDDKQFIYDGCIRLNASIKRAEIIMDKVGLRPGRTQVRLEHDVYITGLATPSD